MVTVVEGMQLLVFPDWETVALYPALHAYEKLWGAYRNWLQTRTAHFKSTVILGPTFMHWGCTSNSGAFSQVVFWQLDLQWFGDKLCTWPKNTFLQELTPSSYVWGKNALLDDVWYSDGSSRGTAPQWIAAALQPSTEALWFEMWRDRTSQWTELQSDPLWCMNKTPSCVMDIQAILRGLALWLPTWATQEWQIEHYPHYGVLTTARCIGAWS